MRSAAVAAIGAGATAAVIVAAFIQAAGDTPAGQALGLSVSVPDQYRGLIMQAGNACPEINPNLLAALLATESEFKPDAVSPVGARGIAQFMPSTWEGEGIDGNGDGKRDISDPEDAIPSAAAYLCRMAKETKDVPGDRQSNMLAAYNAGSDAVVRNGGVPPYKETQGYVKTINALANTPVSGGGVLTAEQVATAINAADDKIGVPYSWGGGAASGASTGSCCSPNGSSGENIVGFDCSGLMLYAYAKAGIQLPRTAADQYAASKPVSREEMRPGDLVFFGSSPTGIHHVGMYVGGGYMIEAPRPGTNVRYSPVDSMSDFYAAARPIPQQNKEI
ncbi:NlpC/P60 family protein [Streptomyces sp. NRRL F-2747]|uniref:C40 family peptidase n=1 Tax=Streptomyces sp. NRRL F-2747 TaxID=1463843 RepID=UPI0004C85D9D|nr:bifunctional lytic transglycosylase/C40 family peptidase [Streptomyces sp. NRRL F-2747]